MTTERQEPAEIAGPSAQSAAVSANDQERQKSAAVEQRPARTRRSGLSRDRLDELVRALGDTTHPLHSVAVDELVSLGAAALPALRAALTPNQSWLTIYRAAEAAGRIGDSRTVGPLVRMLNHPNSNVRWSVVHALAQIGDVRALFALRRVARYDQSRTTWGEAVADAAQSALDDLCRRRGWVQSLELVKTAVVAVLMIFSLVLAYSVVSTLREELARFGRIIPGQTQIPQFTLPTVQAFPEPTNAPATEAEAGPAATPRPTVAPVLAPTTAVTASAILTGTVRQDANVRPFPDTNNQPIGRVSPGDEIIFIARSPNGQWYLVRLGAQRSPLSAINSPDGAGWVNQALVSPPAGELPVQQPATRP